MANYATLKAAIQQAIKANGNKEITGPLLQQQLLAMVNSLGAGYQFAGVATPLTNPGTPDYNVMYIAGPGTYENFGVVVHSGEIGIFRYNGSWTTTVISLLPDGDTYVTIATTQTITGVKSFTEGVRLPGIAPVVFNNAIWMQIDSVIDGDGTKIALTDPDDNPVGLTNIATPTADTDAVNKGYVDTIVGNIDTLLQALL